MSTKPSITPTHLKVGLPVAVFLILTLVNPEAMRAVTTATVRSPTALLIIAGVVGLTLGLSVLLRRAKVDPWAQAGLVLLPMAVISGLYIAPYFQSGTVVDDDFPVAFADTPTQPPVATPEATEPAVTAHEDVTTEAVESEPVETEPVESSDTAAPPQRPVPTAPSQEPTSQAGPATPLELSRGTFGGLDGHYARGQAAIYDLGGGNHLVRLEDVELQPVPEPYVYLVPTANATAPTDGAVSLGPLKGTMGNQNYEVPTAVDLSIGEWTVLVWCEPFRSPVGAASQA